MNHPISISIYLFIIMLSAAGSIIEQCEQVESSKAVLKVGQNTSFIAKKVKNPNYKEDPDFLGEGSFGRVFEIQTVSKPLALKAIKRRAISKWDTDNLTRELTLWPDLSKEIGDAVPILHGCLYDSDYIYILQELLFVDLEDKDFHKSLVTWPLADRLGLFISITDAF